METASVIDFISVVSDPRIERAKKHSMNSILMIGLMSTIAGGDGFNDMEDWGEENRELIEEFLVLTCRKTYPEFFAMSSRVRCLIEYEGCFCL